MASRLKGVSFPASIAPDSAVDVQAEPVEDVQTISMLIAQQEALKVRAQKALDMRRQREAEEAARELAELQALQAAADELARLRALEAEEARRVEQEHKAKLLTEWERSGAQENMLRYAVAAFEERSKHVDPTEQARTIFTQRFGVEAPPASAWARDGLTFEVRLFQGRVICQVDVRPGQESYGIALFGVNEPIPGIASLVVNDKADFGSALSEYRVVADWFGMNVEELPDPVQYDGSGVDITQFGAHKPLAFDGLTPDALEGEA